MFLRGFLFAVAVLITSTSCATRNAACSEVLKIRISENNGLFVDGSLTSFSQLKSVSEDLFLRCPNAPIVIAASGKAATRFLVDVVEMVRGVGLKKVEIETEDFSQDEYLEKGSFHE